MTALDPYQEQVLADWWRERNLPETCPVCGRTDKVIQELVWQREPEPLPPYPKLHRTWVCCNTMIAIDPRCFSQLTALRYQTVPAQPPPAPQVG